MWPGFGRLCETANSDSHVTPSTDPRPLLIWWICLGAIALILLNAVRTWPEVGTLLYLTDNDDLMRLVQVRDWLGGQGWFDTRQYRILPPEGIPMHWSRYVDAGIALVLVPLSWLVPMPQAELLTLVVWPSLLACLMVLVIGHGTNRLFGPLAAIGALVVFLTWGKLRGEFTPPRIDHHNVQMLCATAVLFLALLPGRERLRGALAGVITALSLAVGLEMLPVLALVPGYVALRHAFDQPGADRWLLGYGPVLAVAAPLLMAGQAASWTAMHCDVLAPPVLLLSAIGIVATLVPVLAARPLRGPLLRIGAMAAIVGAGLWLSRPLFSSCLAGPYADIPPDVRALIESRIIEALSVSELIAVLPDLAIRSLLPPLVILILAAGAAAALWSRLDPVQRSALALAFLVAFAGLAVSLLQIRATTLMVPALPLMGGFLGYAFGQIPRASFWRLPALLVLAATTPTAVEEAVPWMVDRYTPKLATVNPASAPALALGSCRSPDAMAELLSLPPSTLFSTLNLGTTILAFTPHSVASAPYHRSPEAFWNGIAAPESEANMQSALLRSGADYLVLCAGEAAKPYAAQLLKGDLPDWLTDASDGRRLWRVFRVDTSRLADVAGQ